MICLEATYLVCGWALNDFLAELAAAAASRLRVPMFRALRAFHVQYTTTPRGVHYAQMADTHYCYGAYLQRNRRAGVVAHGALCLITPPTYK